MMPNISGTEIKGLVSIIIPAYQAEKYIIRSVQSALNQTYVSIEVIVVENGSTDRTLEVIDEIRDERMIILHSDKGVSNARNKGLEFCRGEFFLFLDADDWLEDDAIEGMLSVAKEDVDIVSARYYGDKPFEKYDCYRYDAGSDEYMIKCLCAPTKRGNCTANLYRTRFVKAYDVHFDTDLAHAEDSVFWVRLLVNNPTVMDLEKPVYHVFSNPESATRRTDRIDCSDFIKAITRIYNLLDGRSSLVINAGRIFAVNQLLVILVHSVAKTGIFKGVLEVKNTASLSVFDRAISEASFSDLDVKRRIVFLLLKYKCYFGVLFAVKVRSYSNEKKSENERKIYGYSTKKFFPRRHNR